MKKGLLTVCLIVSILAVQGCGGAPASTANSGTDTSSTASSIASESEKTVSAEEKSQPEEGVIEITVDNWSKYFEIVRETSIREKNADGSVKSLYAEDIFRIKEDYKDKLIECNLRIGYSWEYETKQVASVNKDDLTFELGTVDSIPFDVRDKYNLVFRIDEEQGDTINVNEGSSKLGTLWIDYMLDNKFTPGKSDIPVSDFERYDCVYALNPVNYQIVNIKGTITLSE